MIRPLVLSLTLLLALPLSLFAHKVWLRPSQTVLSGADPWVTFDGAVSNDLFYFNHFPLRLENLTVTAPDGSQVEAENQAIGKYRSVFDLQLKQQGTYRVAVVNSGLMGSWEVNGERKRWRGTAESFATEVPANAQNLQVSERSGRVETFVTNGAPNEAALKPTGKGLEMEPITHPNDLYAGEEGRFRLLIDGKPAAGLEVEVIRGSTRYRDTLNDVHVKTDENGEFAIEWREAGMYWLEATTQDDKTQISQAGSRSLSYIATLEVLPQ